MIGIIVCQKHGVKIQLVYETELLYYLQLANSSIISMPIKGRQEIEDQDSPIYWEFLVIQAILLYT